eukprot:TRINITY_DN13222_c0_g1_i1.p1 TRINITY_DN13222_c0_g1~~TRINITY_DN13222_c0_g1_i1.p1  ORF type:complete len:641 (-),score=93.36 TRINITY_DN13222_c0_g1_i1:380-2302(-)
MTCARYSDGAPLCVVAMAGERLNSFMTHWAVLLCCFAGCGFAAEIVNPANRDCLVYVDSPPSGTQGLKAEAPAGGQFCTADTSFTIWPAAEDASLVTVAAEDPFDEDADGKLLGASATLPGWVGGAQPTECDTKFVGLGSATASRTWHNRWRLSPVVGQQDQFTFELVMPVGCDKKYLSRNSNVPVVSTQAEAWLVRRMSMKADCDSLQHGGMDGAKCVCASGTISNLTWASGKLEGMCQEPPCFRCLTTDMSSARLVCDVEANECKDCMHHPDREDCKTKLLGASACYSEGAYTYEPACLENLGDVGRGISAKTLESYEQLFMAPLGGTETERKRLKLGDQLFDYPTTMQIDEQSQLSEKSSSVSYTSLEEYSTAMATQLSVSGQRGMVKFGAAGKVARQISEALEKNSVMSNSDRSIVTHKAQFLNRVPLAVNFELAAQKAEKDLAGASDSTRKWILSAFFNRWGTHYVRTAYYGGKVSLTSSTARCSSSGGVKTQVEAETEASKAFTAALVNPKIKVSASVSDTTSVNESSELNTLVVTGGDVFEFKANGEPAWLLTVRTKPMIVKRSLDAVDTLLNDYPELQKGLESHLETYMAEDTGDSGAISMPQCKAKVSGANTNFVDVAATICLVRLLSQLL